MGPGGHGAGTVVAAMADAPEPPAEAADEPVDAPAADHVEPPADPVGPARAPQRSARRGIDRRAIVVSALIALLAALGAAFAFTLIVDDEEPAPTGGVLELKEPGDVDVDRLLGVRVEDGSGEATTLDQLRGDGITVVNFWQSACVPCVEEMPLLQAASDARPELTFLGANVLETDEDAAARLIEQTGVTYRTFDDPSGTLFAELGAGALPATIVLDADGSVLATELGEFTDAAELDAFLDEHAA